jgi:hypothetical protein
MLFASFWMIASERRPIYMPKYALPFKREPESGYRHEPANPARLRLAVPNCGTPARSVIPIRMLSASKLAPENAAGPRPRSDFDRPS